VSDEPPIELKCVTGARPQRKGEDNECDDRQGPESKERSEGPAVSRRRNDGRETEPRQAEEGVDPTQRPIPTMRREHWMPWRRPPAPIADQLRHDLLELPGPPPGSRTSEACELFSEATPGGTSAWRCSRSASCSRAHIARSATRV
jgi:hypothetical protein